MTALIVLGCILLFFVFLLSIKVTVTIGYSDEVTLTVKALGIKIPILPSRDKKKGPHSMSKKKAQKIRDKLNAKKKKKNEASRKKAAKKEEAKAHKEEKPRKTLSEILYVIKLVRKLAAKVVKKFAKRLRIDVARLKINIAMGDAATTAIAYGAVTQSLNLLFPILEEVESFGLPYTTDIDVTADFVSDGITADIEISFILRIWHVFDVAFGALFTFLAHLIKEPKPKKKATKKSKGHVI